MYSTSISTGKYVSLVRNVTINPIIKRSIVQTCDSICVGNICCDYFARIALI